MELAKLAKNIRKNTLEALFHAASGHPGPSLSITEIVTSLLFSEMNVEASLKWKAGDSIHPKLQVPFSESYLEDSLDKDILILSKGHAAATIYAALVELDLLPKEQLKTLRDLGSPLQGHLVRGTLPLVSASTGSLGQGLSIAIGRALGSRLKKEERRFYVIIGDGESQEGQIWESAMSASKFELDNLVAIIDYNKFQNDGSLESVMPMGSLVDKWKAFGWNTLEIDGHNFDDLEKAFKAARNFKGKPSAIIAHTVKGKGISFMEGSMDWHSKAMSQEEFKSAMDELG